MKKLVNLSLLFSLMFMLFSCGDEATNSDKDHENKTDSTETTTDNKTEPEETENTVNTKPKKVFTSESGRSVAFYDYEAFKASHFDKQNDTTYVINFWATWCGPCVKELPYFFEAEKALADKPVKFIYASLDSKRKVEKKLLPFLEKEDMNSTVVLLGQKDADQWISKVSEGWDGAIPATLVYSQKANKFYAQSFENAEDVKKIVEDNM